MKRLYTIIVISYSITLLFASLTVADNGATKSVRPVIHLNSPIERQVQLFATDKVIIHGGEGTLESVWFGYKWERYIPGKEYIVWGNPHIPVIPKFNALNRNADLKLEIIFTANPDRPRDLRGPQSNPAER